MDEGMTESVDPTFPSEDSDWGDDELIFDEGAPLLYGKRFYTKLEAVKADEVSFTLRWNHICTLIGLLLSLLMLVLGSTVFSTQNGFTFDGQQYAVTSVLFPDWVLSTAAICQGIMLVVGNGITALYARIIYKQNGKCLSEQIWVLFLLICLVFYVNLIDVVIYLNIGDVGNSSLINEEWVHVLRSLRYTAFAGMTVFYLLANAHSYRILDDKISWNFYVPKIGAVIAYIGIRQLVFFAFDITMLDVPLVTWIPMLRLYGETGWDVTGAICVVVVSLLEAFLVAWILYSMRITQLVLREVEYLHFRTKQVGFRFFVYHNCLFYSVIWFSSCIYALFIPNGVEVSWYLAGLGSNWDVGFFPQRTVICFQFLSFVAVEAYFRLPASKRNIDIVENRIELSDEDSIKEGETPMTYRRMEPRKFDAPSLKELTPNCFIMQTHVTAFNFAWLAYYYGTEKFQKIQKSSELVSFSTHAFIEDSETDTHCLIADEKDRIIVAFRGTSSMRNLKTDVKVGMKKVSSIVPSHRCDERLFGSTEAIDELRASSLFRRSRIHKGFASAHSKVAVQVQSAIEELYERKPRVIIFTGHSLGGSLATLAALDCVLSLGMSSHNIVVSTFGAPRVGNKPFQRLYGEVVRMHWRLELAPDLVTRLPVVLYKHVGRRVLLTPSGTMFLDPNVLEMGLFRKMPVSMVYHRKSSYLLAMRAWCEQHHGMSYTPEFWPWPVSEQDSKHFRTISYLSTRSDQNSSRGHWHGVAEDLGILSSRKSRPSIDPRLSGRWRTLAEKIYLLRTVV